MLDHVRPFHSEQAIKIIERAETKADEIERDSKTEAKERDEEIKRKEERLLKREEMLDERFTGIDQMDGRWKPDHDEGRPVLVGTTSVEKSERLSGMLQRRGIQHQVLNAKQHEREAVRDLIDAVFDGDAGHGVSQSGRIEPVKIEPRAPLCNAA